MRHHLALIPEALLALTVLASVACTAWQFGVLGYLPQPFVFDTNDTFMDWFNTAYWANNPGRVPWGGVGTVDLRQDRVRVRRPVLAS